MSKVVANTLSVLKRLGGKMNMDGLENMLTGLGVSGFDKRMGGAYKRSKYSQSQLEIFHDSSDIAKLVVNKIPEMGTKKWLTHRVDKEEGGIDVVNKIVDEDERLEAKEKFKKAWAWARLYGGSGIFISVADGLDPAEPLNVNRIQKIKSLTVLHRWELQRGELETDINDPNFGLPRSYTISGRTVEQVPRVHHSRILRFSGTPLSEQGFKNNDYWDDSVLSVLHDIARDYDAAYNSIFHALQDFDIDILKLNNLADICAGDDDNLLTSRLKLMQLSKSIMSAVLIDAENESFEKLQRQFQNIDKMLEKCDRRLQLATGLPHTVLFGDGSTGTLGASGESEQNVLNDHIAGEQDTALKKNFKKYSKLVQQSKQGPTNGKLLKSWSFGFNKLNEPTEDQVAKTRKTVAETDAIYYNINVLGPDEIAESRFGGDEYSMETNIDMDAREEMKEADKIGEEETKKALKELEPKEDPKGEDE